MFIRDRKLRISIFAALIFFIVANPETFKIVRKLFGSWVSSDAGCPTARGLALHTVVYLLVTYALMNDGRELLEGSNNGAANNGAAMNNGGAANNGGANMGPPQMPEPQELQNQMTELQMEATSQNEIVGADLTDETQFESVESITNEQAAPLAPAPAPVQAQTDLTRMLSGTSWKKCSCEDGGEVLLLK
jgi:hypothetical protein